MPPSRCRSPSPHRAPATSIQLTPPATDFGTTDDERRTIIRSSGWDTGAFVAAGSKLWELMQLLRTGRGPQARCQVPLTLPSTPPGDAGGMVDPATRTGRDRRHQFPRRDRRISPTFTAAEHADVVAVAHSVGLTPTGFCAIAAPAVARGETGAAALPSADIDSLRTIQAELFDVRTAVNRAGTNLNQAVAALNATGEAPSWLHNTAARLIRTFSTVDDAISAIHRRLR